MASMRTTLRTFQNVKPCIGLIHCSSQNCQKIVLATNWSKPLYRQSGGILCNKGKLFSSKAVHAGMAMIMDRYIPWVKAEVTSSARAFILCIACAVIILRKSSVVDNLFGIILVVFVVLRSDEFNVLFHVVKLTPQLCQRCPRVTKSQPQRSTWTYHIINYIIVDYLFVFVGAVFVALRSEEPDLISWF